MAKDMIFKQETFEGFDLNAWTNKTSEELLEQAQQGNAFDTHFFGIELQTPGDLTVIQCDFTQKGEARQDLLRQLVISLIFEQPCVFYFYMGVDFMWPTPEGLPPDVALQIFNEAENERPSGESSGLTGEEKILTYDYMTDDECLYKFIKLSDPSSINWEVLHHSIKGDLLVSSVFRQSKDSYFYMKQQYIEGSLEVKGGGKSFLM